MESDLGEQLRAAMALLQRVAEDRKLLTALSHEDRVALEKVCGEVFLPDVADRRRYTKAIRNQAKAREVAGDQNALAETGIRVLRAKPVFTTPNVFAPIGPGEGDSQTTDDEVAARRSTRDRHCYVCKRMHTAIHPFYDQMCQECGNFNFAKRTQTADLHGRVALLTGGRVKIGYQAGIKLLRAGAHVIVSTRFPRDSAHRYAQEPDFEEWSHRLEIHGLDLRHTPSVEAFCAHVLKNHDRLDFIVNNACQTVRRPPDFYRHMMELETSTFTAMPANARQLLGRYEGLRGYDLLQSASHLSTEVQVPLPIANQLLGLTKPAELSQAPLLPDELQPRPQLFPEGQLDKDLQQVDLRDRNSWRLTLAEVSSVELLETQLVNAVAPFVLNARLKPLMLRTAERDKHIVNVSAVEGQFYRKMKTTRHPHTNMAKAALNMMTRTSAADYQADGIHMNSVDTGWVSDEDPLHIAERKTAEQNFHPPLDIVDGASRILDPIFSGLQTGEHMWGQFLKDYRPTDW